MSLTFPILKSKLRSPARIKGIRQHGLRSVGASILEKKLTSVVAGPGFGKTTLIAQALYDLDAQVVWYRLDRTDGDLPTFLSYLVAGIRKIYPDFRGAAVLDRQCASDGEADGELLVQWLLAELEKCLQGDLILVLDDFHRVQACGEIKKALNDMLRVAGPAMHVILISRSPIDLALSRLKAQRQLLEITSAHLSFSRDETARLCEEVFKVRWGPDLLDRIHNLTQGWISGLTLVRHAFRDIDADDMAKCLRPPSSLPDTIYDYLEEEVFSPLSSEIKHFLVQTSILNHLQASFCDQWLETDTSQTILADLKTHRLFVGDQDEPEDSYVYHNAFRQFLLRKLAARSPAGTIAGLHRKAAALFEARDAMEAALPHFLAAGDYKEVVRVLNAAGRHLYQEGKYDLLKSCLDATPLEYFDDFPWVQCLHGKLHGVRGHHAAAAASYGQALVKFQQRKETEGIYLCQIEIALNGYLAGQFGDAAEMLVELLSQKSISDELRIEALGYLIYLSTQLRHKDAWSHYHRTTRSVLQRLDAAALSSRLKVWLDVHRGYACLTTGDSREALEIGRSVEWRLKQLDAKDFFYGHHALMASANCFLHRFEEGLACARKGLAGLARESQSEDLSEPNWQPARPTPMGIRDRGGHDTALPLILLQAARNAFGLGRTDEAIGYARKSRAAFRGMGIEWGQAWALNALSTAYARKGDGLLAEQSALEGLRLIKRLDLPFVEGTLKGNLAVILTTAKRYKEALPLIRDAQKAFACMDLSHWIDLWQAYYLWHQDPDQGRAEFLAVLTRCDRVQNFFIVTERHWIVPLLVDIYARGHLHPYIFDTLCKIGPDAVVDLKQILRDTRDTALRSAATRLLKDLPKPDPPGLRVHMLGRFHVFAGKREIGVDKWTNTKVRSLFLYLAYAYTQGHVNRDVLIEMLWPDQDPGKTKNRFHVAMTALRRVLEPDLPDGAPSSYIVRVGDAYRLNPGESGAVDMHVFTGCMARARDEKDDDEAAQQYLLAVDLYAGDLMAEDPFCHWSREIRQNLRRMYLEALEAVIAHFSKHGAFEQCIEYAEKYLAADRTAEEIYRKLMGFYARISKPALVAATLRRCRENLQAELDCAIEPETEALARQLLSHANLSAT